MAEHGGGGALAVGSGDAHGGPICLDQSEGFGVGEHRDSAILGGHPFGMIGGDGGGQDHQIRRLGEFGAILIGSDRQALGLQGGGDGRACRIGSRAGDAQRMEEPRQPDIPQPPMPMKSACVTPFNVGAVSPPVWLESLDVAGCMHG